MTHVDQQGFLFISFPFQLPSLSLCSIYTMFPPPLASPAIVKLIYIPHSLALSSFCHSVLCMKKPFSISNKYVAAISPASKQRQVAGEFSSPCTGDGYKKCAEFTWRGRCNGRGNGPLAPLWTGCRGEAGGGLIRPPPRL